jgi:superfamily II DNA or RNA helicase
MYPIQAGIIGGGEFTTRDVTVITYDSAVRHVEHLGSRFGLVVFDECHHLPGEMYSEIARMSLAPFRLGLTATPQRSDGGESILDDLVGPIVFSSRVSSLAGNVLASYETKRIAVSLNPQEDGEYKAAREHYLGFCRQHGVRLGNAGGWTDFLRKTARSRAGREAFAAYRKQRNIPLTCDAKFTVLAQLLRQHHQDRIIIFTHVNELAYRISRHYLIPVITHQTPTRERAKILDHFASGIYPAVVTSRVLNEGVDVPEANVAIIMSGSGSIREHVQRLGRILRQQEGKKAMLYEVVAEQTHEHGMSVRRTRHEAYRQRRGGK